MKVFLANIDLFRINFCKIVIEQEFNNMLQFAAAAVTMSYSYSKHNHVTVSKLQASS